MKDFTIFKFTLCLLALYFSTFAIANSLCIKPWRIGIYENNPFQDYINGQPFGIEVDIIKKVATKLNCKVEFSNIPWKRQFVEAQSGKIDIIMGAAKRKEREDYLYYLWPYINEPSTIVFLEKNANKFNNFSLKNLTNDKSNLSIGVVIGVVYSDEYEELLKNENFTKHLAFTTKSESNIKKLITNRVDANIYPDINEVKYLIKKFNIKEKLVMLTLNKEDFVYFTYSKKTFTSKNAQIIDNEIQKMIKENIIEKMMSKYFTKEEIKIMKIDAYSKKSNN